MIEIRENAPMKSEWWTQLNGKWLNIEMDIQNHRAIERHLMEKSSRSP